MKRRTLLGACALSAVVSGCLGSLRDDTPEEPVASPAIVEVHNYSGERVTVGVTARKDGESVYDEEHTIDEIFSGESPSIDGALIAEEWMGSPAAYEFSFAVPEYGLTASFDTDDPISPHAGVAVSENDDFPTVYDSDLDGVCYFVRAYVGDGTPDPTPDSPPEAILTWADVYDHAVWERDGVSQHVPDCT